MFLNLIEQDWIGGQYNNFFWHLKTFGTHFTILDQRRISVLSYFFSVLSQFCLNFSSVLDDVWLSFWLICSSVSAQFLLSFSLILGFFLLNFRCIFDFSGLIYYPHFKPSLSWIQILCLCIFLKNFLTLFESISVCILAFDTFCSPFQTFFGSISDF